MFPDLREAVAKLMDPAHLRHIAWSHFESDECGALNQQPTEIPLAYGIFCAAYDWCIAAYLYTRRGQWAIAKNLRRQGPKNQQKIS